MATGVVARFDSKRGFGFVIPDDGGEDLFVHQNNIVMEGFRSLRSGERVKFEIEMGDKGGKAVSVELLETRQEEESYRPRQQSRNGGSRSEYGSRNGNGYSKRNGASSRDTVDIEDFNRLKLKHERLLSLLTAKGVLAPGEIDGVAADEQAEDFDHYDEEG